MDIGASGRRRFRLAALEKGAFEVHSQMIIKLILSKLRAFDHGSKANVRGP